MPGALRQNPASAATPRWFTCIAPADCAVSPTNLPNSSRPPLACSGVESRSPTPNSSGDRQQRDVPYVLVGDVQENRSRRVVTDQRRNVDDALMPEQLHGASEGLRIDFAFADRIASELDDDPLLFSQRARGPAELHRVDDHLLQARLPGGWFVGGPDVFGVHLPRRHQNRQLDEARLET